MAISKGCVRITDVAVGAGVGVGTVSRVLNGSPQGRESTRARVLEAIEQTRYRPSRLAADLSRGSPASVAIVVPFVTRSSVVARFAGVIEVLDGEGYDTISATWKRPPSGTVRSTCSRPDIARRAWW
jgi:DNA-binding LacI/PurR family transcriptional regulator